MFLWRALSLGPQIISRERQNISPVGPTNVYVQFLVHLRTTPPLTFYSSPHNCSMHPISFMPTRWIRPSISTLGKHFLRRSFYSKTAEFVTRDPQGRPCQRQVDIRVGDEHEAYVLVPTDVGDAIKAACKHNGSSFPQDKQSLEFNHDRRDFTCGM